MVKKKKIVELRASLNKGISGELAKNFPNIQPVERPKVEKSIDRSYIYIYIYITTIETM